MQKTIFIIIILYKNYIAYPICGLCVNIYVLSATTKQ